jgi:hypothetical protein
VKLKVEYTFKDKFGNYVKITDIVINISDKGVYTTDIIYWLTPRNGENSTNGFGRKLYKIEPNAIGFLYKLPVRRFVKLIDR